MTALSITTKYLWLDGCDPRPLQPDALEELLHDAVTAASFTIQYTHVSTHDDRTVALAVLGESHVMLTSDPPGQSLAAEVVSCSATAADAALDAIRRAVPHGHASEQVVSYQIESDQVSCPAQK